MSRPGAKAGHSVFDEIAKQMPLIRRVLQRRGVPGKHVDDLVQETLLLAWEKLQSGALPERMSKAFIRGWLTKVAKYKACNIRRTADIRTGLVSEGPGVDAVLDETPGMEQRMCDSEALRDLLGQLKPKYREVLLLDALGYSGAEIAAAIGIGRSSAASRLHMARRHARGAG